MGSNPTPGIEVVYLPRRHMTSALLLGLGLAAGAFGALLGIGGGLIIMSGLTILLGLPVREAVAIGLVCVCANSASSSAVYLRKGSVELPIGVELQCFAVLGAVVSGLVAPFIPPQPIYYAVAAILLYTAWRMVPRERRVSPPQHRGTPWLANAASVGAGLLSGLTGIGGGIINTPVLHLMLDVPFERAVPTSSYMIGVTAAASGSVYLARGDLNATSAALTLLGSLGGAALGASLAPRVNVLLIRYSFILLLLYIAWEMTGRALGA